MKEKKKRGRIWTKVLWGLGMLASIFAGFWVARTQIVFSSVNRDTTNVLKNVELPGGTYHSDEKIVNILIIGNDYREEKNYTAAGLPDSMMIGTLDKKHKNLKLTSLMRDQLVQIPGYGEDRLNACFRYGDVTLLHQTIAQNFGVKVDGYVELDFNAVKEVVNRVGGIQIELTESEANYLNTTNYIKPAKYRNVKVGMNKLNGAQALGYSRIRKKVYTPNGLTDDYGRTWRQRNVVNAVFNKVKTMSPSQLMDMAQVILSNYVKTDLTSQDMVGYITDVIMMGTTDIYQLQIPMDGYYTNDPDYGTLGDVLIPDLTANERALNQFIFDYIGRPGEEFTYSSFYSTGSATSSQP